MNQPQPILDPETIQERVEITYEALLNHLVGCSETLSITEDPELIKVMSQLLSEALIQLEILAFILFPLEPNAHLKDIETVVKANKTLQQNQTKGAN